MPADLPIVRDAVLAEFEVLAALWHQGWRDGHLAVVPAALAELRTLDSFTARLRAAFADVRVAGPPGAPLGFHLLKDDELYQFYVAEPARGTGVAAALMRDAEQRLVDRRVGTAWLACAIGNARAARFYEKCGWHLAATITSLLETPAGIFPLDVWRYEKRLR